MSGQDLMVEMDQQILMLNKSVRELRNTSRAYAQAEMDYKILLNQECLKLRDSGMAVGMIDKVCYGIPSVAQARFKRDCAEAIYKANQESINSIKLQLRLLEGQISREWGQSK